MKFRDFMLSKVSIRSTMIFTFGFWAVLVGLVLMGIDIPFLRNLFIGAITMLLASTMFQLFSRNEEKELTPLRYLQHIENSISDLYEAAKLLWYELLRYHRLFLYMVLLYAAAYFIAPWALDSWGDTLSPSTKDSIIQALQTIFTYAVFVAVLIGTMCAVYFFGKIAYRNHFSRDEDKLQVIMNRLKEDQVKIKYIHNDRGRCKLDVNYLLNRLANRSIKDNATHELYWMIKDNYAVLHRFEVFPVGKKKTPVQALSESIMKQRANEA